MPRKTRTPDWTPNPEADAALARILDTAHAAAAAFWGEKPVENPNDASTRAIFGAMQMVYFLCRIDPADMRALCTGPGSTADFNYKPFEPGRWYKRGILEDLAEGV